MNHYELLGVPTNASAQEIKSAWRAKMLLAHPDKGGRADQMRALTEAKEVLSDAERRRAYDHKLRCDSANHMRDFKNTTEITTEANLLMHLGLILINELVKSRRGDDK